MEKRVVRNLDFVIKDAGSSHIQADRGCVTDEVHFMPPVREFEPEFGGNNPAASVGGVASNANPHGSSISRKRFFGCGVTVQAVSTIFPMCSPLSMRSWAKRASRSGKVESM